MIKNKCVGCEKDLNYKIFTDYAETGYYCTDCIVSCCDCEQTFLKSKNNAKCECCKKEMCFECVLNSFNFFGDDDHPENIKEEIYKNPLFTICKPCRHNIQIEVDCEKFFYTEKKDKIKSK